MPKGLKQTSSQIVISFDTTESAANTFTEERVDLQLNALDNEVFVVTGVNMDVDDPQLNLADPLANFPDAERNVRAFLSKQSISSATTKSLGNPSVFATAKKSFQLQNTTSLANATVNLLPIVPYMEDATDAPYDVDYLDIIATADFFVSVVGQGNGDARGVAGKVYGYRARADASTYAALVQSELLSN